MTDEEKSKELTRSSFAAQMAMLGYEPNGNPKDMVEVVRCKDCKHGEKAPTFKYYPDMTWCNKYLISHNDDWFCADGSIKENINKNINENIRT